MNHRSSTTVSKPISVLTWFLVGLGAAVLLQWIQVTALGGRWDALLSVGEVSEARPLIEADLPDVTIVELNGHDGQSTYLISQAPWGSETAAGALDHAGFRYRRILLPMVGGGFGTFSPTATVAGLAAVSALGLAAGAAGMASIASNQQIARFLPLAVILAPGMWLSMWVSTPDALAMGLAIVGIATLLSGRHRPAIAALVGAALAKEIYVLVAIALAAGIWRRNRRLALITVAGPLGALVAWSTYITAAVGGGFSPRGNLGVPLKGIVDSLGTLSQTASDSRYWFWLSLISVGVAIVAALRASDAGGRFLIIPWIVAAILATDWVWQLGNNAARAFLPLFPFAALLLSGAKIEPKPPAQLGSTSRRNLPV